MKKVYLVAASLVTGLVMAGSVAGTTFAWHPKGEIKKWAQNQTTNGQLTDADDNTTAVATKPGDVVKYVIKVSNVAEPAGNGYNDMAFTVMTDTLPAGVELVDNPSQREIKVDMGTLKPGESVTKEYLVRITSKQDGAFIKNTACYTGDSLVKDHPQGDCNDAVVKVKVPEVPKTPEEPKQPEKPVVLPVTGPANLVGVFAGVSGLGYALHRIVLRKR